MFCLQTSVVVIGAGASGIAAARRLQDFNVKVSEEFLSTHFVNTVIIMS